MKVSVKADLIDLNLCQATLPDLKFATQDFLNDHEGETLIKDERKLFNPELTLEEELALKLVLSRHNANEDKKSMYITSMKWNEKINKFDIKKSKINCNYKRYLNIGPKI